MVAIPYTYPCLKFWLSGVSTGSPLLSAARTRSRSSLDWGERTERGLRRERLGEERPEGERVRRQQEELKKKRRGDEDTRCENDHKVRRTPQGDEKVGVKLLELLELFKRSIIWFGSLVSLLLLTIWKPLRLLFVGQSILLGALSISKCPKSTAVERFLCSARIPPQ